MKGLSYLTDLLEEDEIKQERIWFSFRLFAFGIADFMHNKYG